MDIGYSDFRSQIMTIKELLDLWISSGIGSRGTIKPIISRTQRSRYIESVLIGMPLQPLYVDNTEGEWLYISGEERAISYVEFCMNIFPLNSLYFKQNLYGGCYFADLSNLAKQKILSTQILVHVLNPGLSRHERFGIYTSLKPTLNSHILRSCRKKIYRELYYIIEDIASEIIKRDRPGYSYDSNLENEICHLLVFAKRDVLSDKDWASGVDLIANKLLELPHNNVFEKNIEDRIFSTLLRTRHRISNRYGTDVRDLYNAVVYSMPEMSINEYDFLFAYRQTSTMSDYELDDFESFNKHLRDIINCLSND